MMENENLLPKNIRQIGEIQGRQKICLEDYVMTYIRKMESRGNGNYLGILLGERKNTDDAEYVFVRGIMEAPDSSRTKKENVAEKKAKDTPVLEKEENEHQDRRASDDDGEKKEQERLGLWQAFQKRYETAFGHFEGAVPYEKSEEKTTGQSKHNAKEESKKEPKKESKENSGDRAKEKGSKGNEHVPVEPVDPWQAWKQEQERRFPGWEIQGCCVIGTYPSGQLEELSSHFPEAARMLYHLQDQEERLYWQKGEQYEGVRGYFVFYEQNPKMQEYLSELFGGGSVEKEGGSDGAIISFREKVRSKAEEKSQSFLRLASSFFVVGVLIVGTIVVNRVSDMREAQSVSGTGQVSAVSENQSTSDEANDSMGTLDEAVIADASETADVRTASGSGVENTDVTDGAEDDAVSVSGESVLAGSDAFWADGEEDVEEATSDITESADVVESAEDATESSTDAAGDAAETALADEETVEESTEATEASSRQVQAAYVIREGDTLAEICVRYYGSLDRLEELCEANGIEDANLILPGQKIVLP